MPVSVGGTADELDDSIIETSFAKIDPFAWGVAVGLVSGVGLTFATAILLIKGREHGGQTLSLLGNHLPGFEVTWTGAVIGSLELGLMGFGLGYLEAWLRNWVIQAYAKFVRWHGEVESRRDLLDKL